MVIVNSSSYHQTAVKITDAYEIKVCVWQWDWYQHIDAYIKKGHVLHPSPSINVEELYKVA